MKRERPVSRLENPTVERFRREFLMGNEPVVVTGVATQWRCMTLWTNNYMRSKAGESRVNISVSGNGYFHLDPSKRGALPSVEDTTFEEMTFGMFLDYLENAELHQRRRYLQQIEIRGNLPALAKDLERPQYILYGELRAINLWLGPPGNTSPLHFDRANNFLVQLRGQKRVVLFSPSDSDKLYPYPEASGYPHMSRVNPDAPDLLEFPQLRNAQPFYCVLSQGEMLFIPTAWWHHVLSLDETMSVNYWWRPNPEG
jgi:lysine-specific demethylase 8